MTRLMQDTPRPRSTRRQDRPRAASAAFAAALQRRPVTAWAAYLAVLAVVAGSQGGLARTDRLGGRPEHEASRHPGTADAPAAAGRGSAWLARRRVAPAAEPSTGCVPRRHSGLRLPRTRQAAAPQHGRPCRTRGAPCRCRRGDRLPRCTAAAARATRCRSRGDAVLAAVRPDAHRQPPHGVPQQPALPSRSSSPARALQASQPCAYGPAPCGPGSRCTPPTTSPSASWTSTHRPGTASCTTRCTASGG